MALRDRASVNQVVVGTNHQYVLRKLTNLYFGRSSFIDDDVIKNVAEYWIVESIFNGVGRFGLLFEFMWH